MEYRCLLGVSYNVFYLNYRLFCKNGDIIDNHYVDRPDRVDDQIHDVVIA